ncbi:hypothetical protein [Desulfurobacterium atlanticum]|uniref:DUF2232 domain-containing protein n=1 Tax=Desulfurobacterium atlanticum TaxID=240169 RepID=A0A238ZH58_9BACT|nr:hypothetical protein [Desulfurobacterium atlanticum]SNR82502.1 hypothetical protein SAMN06265340_10875 [Desulfurobacterium atlanticum]
MNRYKVTFVILILICVAGFTLGRESLAPFGWGLSLFIPAAIYTGIKNEGIVPVSFVSVAGIAAVFLLSGWETALSIAEMALPGYLLTGAIKKGIKDGRLALLLTLYFYLVSIAEDFLFGPPKDFTAIQTILPFRWGIYFFSSAFFAVIVIGTVAVIGKEKINFKNINFGAIPVVIFILGGILSLIKWLPELQIIGANLTIATVGFFLIQGFAVTVSLIDRLGTFSRLVIFFVAIIFPLIALLIVSLMGLFDFWFDFRKLKGGRT